MIRCAAYFLLAALALLVGAATASAQDATAIPIGGATAVGAVQGASRPAVFTLDAHLAQRIDLAIDTPTTGALIAKVYRPGAQDAGLPPRKTLTLYQGANRYPLVIDWPGRWTIEVSGAVDAPVSIAATQTAAGLTGDLAGATTVDDASGLLVGATVIGSTLDPAKPTSAHGRFLLVQAEAGDRVQVRVTAIDGRPLRVEALRPGTTDASADGDEPVAVLPVADVGTLTFTADTAGQWIIRIQPTPGAKGTTRPAPFTATLDSVVPPDPATTCVDDVTDIGLTKVRGCVKTGRNSVTATGAITIGGVDFTPATDAPLRIDPKTLEVTSTGDFAVDILGMRVLQATRYFLLDDTYSYTVPDDEQLFGLPIAGKASATFSLQDGGTVTVEGTAKLPQLGVDGRLEFSVSGDSGLRGLHVGLGVEYLYGTAFNGSLVYRREVSGSEFVNVWRGNLNVSLGVAKPAWLTGGEADTAINDQITDATEPALFTGASGSLEFRDGKLAFLRAATSTNIPIGATGLVVTRLGAGLRWDPYFALDGTGTLSLGPEVAGASALAISGQLGWANGGSCPGSSIDGKRWYGGGTAVIAKWFSILALDACYQQAETPYVVITGQSGFGIEGVLTGTARFDGYVLGKQAMMIDGQGRIDVWGVGVDGRVVLSNAGYAACGAAYINIFGMKRRVEVGAEGPWSGGTAKAGFACPDFAPYLTVPVARAARTDGIPVTVPKGVDQVNLLVRGAGGVTGVDIVAPDGTVVAQSTSTTEPTLAGAVFAPRAETGEMQIALPIVQAGTYLIRAQAGGTIASVQTSLPRPDVTVRARVVRVGGKRVLRYTITGLDGRRVRFVDTARGTGRLLATVRSATGTLPLRGPGVHRVTAAVIDEQGLAQAPVAVARYRARA